MPTSNNRSLFASMLLTSIAATAAIASACSGKTVDATAADAGSQTDGSPLPSDCPTTAPADGDPCTHDKVVCEYGEDFDPRCNVVRVCSGTRWASPVTFGGSPMCPTSPPTVPPNPSDCAATRESVPTGTSCSSKSTCSYDGSTCFCARYCPSYPIRQPDCDAGQTAGCCSATVQWNCFDGPPICPTPRPRVGSACPKEGDSCAVSAPAECGQPTLDCTGGVWTFVDYGCPVSTARAKRDIGYVDDATEERLREDLLRVRLATYRYKTDDAAHLGFIIEDMPEGSPAVLPSRDRVDLYGYVTMAVAAIHAQQREIDALKREVASCQGLKRPLP